MGKAKKPPPHPRLQTVVGARKGLKDYSEDLEDSETLGIVAVVVLIVSALSTLTALLLPKYDAVVMTPDAENPISIPINQVISVTKGANSAPARPATTTLPAV